jgi:uncharacterized membrane protein YccC
LLGESLIDIGGYLLTKSDMYSKHTSQSAVYGKLLQQQIVIHNLQQEIRELMFKTRRFVKESTDKSRRLMMTFLDSIDLFEQVMTSQQDYEQLHKDFDDSGILEQFKKNIAALAHKLQHIGLSVQAGTTYVASVYPDEVLAESKKAFTDLRKEKLNATTVEAFITLRHILTNLEKLTERVNRIQLYLDKKEKVKQREIETDPFISHQEFNLQLVISNLTVKSTHFRHAIRVTAALLIGYITSLYLSLGHGYWILLTIASIMKPAFGISRQRNLERIGGTLTGGVAGFVILYITHNHTAVFICMLVAMALAYSFLRLQYFISSAFITIYVLLSFFFLQGTLATVLSDRVLDTVLGGVIALACSYFILPSWEHSQINDLLVAAVKANKEYFTKVAGVFAGQPVTNLEYKIARKNGFVALANLADALQRMLSEPKSRRLHMEEYHQFVTANHILTSYIASVSYYAQQYSNRYEGSDFAPMIKTINSQMEYVLALLENEQAIPDNKSGFPINKKVEKLLEQRRQQLQNGEADSDIRKTLSELKSVTDQFRLIHSVLSDEIRILRTIRKAVN